MTIVSPSLLSADFLHLQDEIEALNKIDSLWLHLDIMDGHFVPNLTFGHSIIHQLSTVAQHPLDAHLMVTNPTFYVESLKKTPLHNITIHYEATYHHDRLIHSIKDHFPSVGISFNPGTSIQLVPDYILEMVDLILIMSVNPGFGGQKFIPGVYEKINYLQKKRRELKTHFQIQVDGGVDDKNAPQLIKSGVDNLVAGSYIFKVPSAEYHLQVAALRS